MARRSRQSAAPVISPKILEKINNSFDNGLNPAEDLQLSRPTKKRRKLIIEDDEEEQMIFEPIESSGAGFVAEKDDEDMLEEGGGFLAEIVELDIEAGGFLPELETAGGGFMMDDSVDLNIPLSAVDNPFNEEGGGFLMDDGGFLPEEEAEGGGFMLDDSEDINEQIIQPSSQLDSPKIRKPLPPVNPFALLPLLEVPAALERLRIARPSQISLMAMFSDATEKNEEGEDCISRSQFIQGCSVFVTENDQESQGEEDFDAEVVDSGDGSGEEYQEEEQVKSSSSRRSGRVTRMNPTPRGAAALVEQDQEGLESNQEISIVASDSEELSEIDDEDIRVMSSSSKATPSKSTPLKKSRSKKKDRNRILSRAEVEDAEDTFDLFFHEDSSQMFVESHDRTIGMEEMRYVSNLLGQKLTDEDLLEMLDYAARDEGLVDISAFSKTLAEAV